jgi:2'-hydroxyisoflavone reductase
MRVLVLGGSWFVGRFILDEALRRGWEVTLFNRGTSGPAGVPAAVKRIYGDRERLEDVARLAKSGWWDVVIDVSGAVPTLVRDSARALSGRVGRYVFISTISAYRDWPHVPVDEHSVLFDGDPDFDPGTRRWDPDAYGPLKVGCERAIAREFDGEVLTLRPTVILGPHEYVGRLPWWLSRMHRGGRVLAPGPPERTIQPVDVRDLARFTVELTARQASGVYNVAAPIGRDTWADLLSACIGATGGNAEVVWVEEGWLQQQGVLEWTEIPLWRTLPTAWTMSADKAHDAGLRCRALADTVADTWAWLCSGRRPIEHERAAEHGIEAQREEELLAQWDARVTPVEGP